MGIEKMEERMEELGKWARRGSKGIWSTSAIFEKSHRKDDVP
jgi:hypothetical protein